MRVLVFALAVAIVRTLAATAPAKDAEIISSGGNLHIKPAESHGVFISGVDFALLASSVSTMQAAVSGITKQLAALSADVSALKVRRDTSRE